MADPEIKSYTPHHESQSAAVTESLGARSVLMIVAFAFLGIFLLLPLIIVFSEAFSKGVGAYALAQRLHEHRQQGQEQEQQEENERGQRQQPLRQRRLLERRLLDRRLGADGLGQINHGANASNAAAD